MIRGYARVSTSDQNLDLQVRALLEHGCAMDQIYTDRASGSGSGADRPALAQLFAALQSGDTLVIWALDRLMRDLRQLLEQLSSLSYLGVHLVAVKEHIDSRTASGQLMVHITGALAEFESARRRERVIAGLEAAKSRGQTFGRPAALSPVQVDLIRGLAMEGVSYRILAQSFRVGRSTIAAAVNHEPPYHQGPLGLHEKSATDCG